MEVMDGVGLEETLAISEEQLLERHRRGDGVSAEDITCLLVTNQKLLVKNAVAKLFKEPSSDSSSLALTGRRSTASGAIDGSESTVLVEAPTDEGVSRVEAAARALLGSFPDATVEGGDTGLHASVAEATSSGNNKHDEEEEALALAAANAAFVQWDAPSPQQQQRQPLASLVATGALPRAASLGAWCRLAGAEKAATGGATLAELVLKADGPTGVPAGSRGLDGGPSEGTPGASVDSATRHRIRKDLQRSRCSVEFETTVDSDPMHGSLYRLLIAYACLDPQVGYVQGMNFIAALCLAVAKPDPSSSSSGSGAEGTSSSSSSDRSISNSYSSTGSSSGSSSSDAGGADLAARRAAIEAEGTEAAFLLFTRMMQASGLRKVFDTQDDLLHTLILRLDWHLRGCLPNLHAHLEQEEVGATMFAVEWITTLFVYNVPFDTARALLGLFLIEGSMVGFVVPLGLALLAHLEAELLTRQFDTLVAHLKARLKSFPVGELLGAVRHLGRRMRFVRDYTTTPDTSLQQGSTAGGMAEGAMADGKNGGGAGGSGFSGVGFHGGIVGGLGGGHSSSSSSYGSYSNSSANGEGQSRANAPHGGSSSGEYGVAAQLAHVVGSAADSREAWQRLKRPRWVPDDEAFRCANVRCMRYFNALSVRKHHCRACGRVYCGPCAATRGPLPLLAYKGELVRVCVPCTVAGAGAPAAWLFQEFQYQQQRNGGGEPSSALTQPSAGTTVTTAGAPLALPAKAWRQCLAYVCDAPVLSIPMLVELATPIAAHNDDDDSSDDYGIRSSHGGGGADGPHESIGRAFLGRLGLPAMASPLSPRSTAAGAAAAAGAGTGAVASGEHGEGPHDDESNGVVVVGGDGHPNLSRPTNTSTAAGKALAHLFAPLGQGLGALQLPWSTLDERGSDDDEDGWADGDLNGSLDLNSSSSVRVVPATVATRGRVLVASSAGNSSSSRSGSSNIGAQGLGASSAAAAASSAAAAATGVSVDEEQTMLTGGVADALLSSSPSLSPAVGSGGSSDRKSSVPLMGLDDNAGSSDPLDLEDVLASATEDFSRSALAVSSSGRRGSGLGDNTAIFFGGSGGATSLPDDFLETFPLTSKGDPGLPSAHGEEGTREGRALGAQATATAKQTPPPLPPPPKTLGASRGRAAAGAAALEAVQTGAHTRATATAATAAPTAGAPPPLPLPPRQFSSSPGSVNAPPSPSSPPVLPPPPPVPPPPRSILAEAAAGQQQPLVPPPLPPPPKIVVASQADGSVASETTPAAKAPAVASSASASDSSSSGCGSSTTSSSDKHSNSNSDNGTASSSATTGSTQDNASQGQSDDVLSQPAREGVASHVTAMLVDIFGKAPPPPLPPPSPNSRGVSSEETGGSSRGPTRAEDVDKARESALAAELEALGRDFDVDDDYESLRAFANALDHGGSPPSGKVIATTTAAAAAAGDLKDSKGSSLKSPSAGTEDLEDDLFGSTRPLPPPSADGALRSSFVDINAGDGDVEDDFMEGGNWRQSIVRPGEGSGKGLFDFD